MESIVLFARFSPIFLNFLGPKCRLTDKILFNILFMPNLQEFPFLFYIFLQNSEAYFSRPMNSSHFATSSCVQSRGSLGRISFNLWKSILLFLKWLIVFAGFKGASSFSCYFFCFVNYLTVFFFQLPYPFFLSFDLPLSLSIFQFNKNSFKFHRSKTKQKTTKEKQIRSWFFSFSSPNPSICFFNTIWTQIDFGSSLKNFFCNFHWS